MHARAARLCGHDEARERVIGPPAPIQFFRMDFEEDVLPRFGEKCSQVLMLEAHACKTCHRVRRKAERLPCARCC